MKSLPLLATLLSFLTLDTLAMEISSGDTVEGSMTRTETYNFQVTAGEKVIVEFHRIGSTVTPSFGLYSPGGELLESITTTCSRGLICRDVLVQMPPHVAQTTGTYSIRSSEVTDLAEATYRFTLAIVPRSVLPNGDSGSLSNGVTQSGTSNSGDIDLWTFEAEQGDPLFLSLDRTDLNGSIDLELYDPAGNLVADAGITREGSSSTTAPASGLFTVLLRGANGASNPPSDYRVLYINPNMPDFQSDAGAIVNGRDTEAELVPLDYDLWSFSAKAGNSVLLSFGEISGSFTPEIEVFGPNGAPVVWDQAAFTDTIGISPSVDGVYKVLLKNNSTFASGSYRASLLVLPAPIDTSGDNGALTAGELASGTIDVGDLDVWAFNAEVGDNLSMVLAEVNTGSFRPGLALFGPSGNFIGSLWNESTVNAVYQVAEQGTHYIVVSDFGYLYAGDYTVSATGFTGPPLQLGLAEPLPKLTIARLPNGQLELRWPDNSGFTLERSTNGLSGWQVTDQGVSDGDERTKTLVPSGSAFFRLNDSE